MTSKQILATIDRELIVAQRQVRNLLDARDAVASIYGRRGAMAHGRVLPFRRKRVLSAAARKRISQAQKARWAVWKKSRAA